jgi:hypothetical protein
MKKFLIFKTYEPYIDTALERLEKEVNNFLAADTKYELLGGATVSPKFEDRRSDCGIITEFKGYYAIQTLKLKEE